MSPSEDIGVGRLLALLALAVVALLAAVPASAGAARVYVGLTFDDGTRTQYDFRHVLDAHGVKGTYYVNSGKVGQPGYMTWDELRELRAAGHEIGGHTRDHRRLTTLTRPEQVEQVCDDRDALVAEGFDVRNFAYPHGAYDAQVMAVVRDCGYDSGRTTGGTDIPAPCCIFSNRFPFDRLYDARAAQPDYSVTLEQHRELIGRAREHGGGWLPLVFHDVCAAPCAGIDDDRYYVSDETLDALIRWIEADPELRIGTTAHAMAINGDLAPPAVELTAPADGARVIQGDAVALAATASDAVGVDRVEFYAGDELIATDDSAPYEATWDADELGDASFHAVAHDEAGHAGRSPVVTVTVEEPDTTPPTVALLLPADGAVVAGDVALAATAEDDRGPIEQVEFLVDGVVVHTDTSPPYIGVWDASTAQPGATVVLTARARDGAGNVGTSAPRTVTVARRRDPDPPRPPDPDPPVPPDPDPPAPPRPDPPAPPVPDPPAPRPDRPRPPRDATAPRVRVTATLGAGRRLVVRVVATDPSGVGPIRLLINGRTARMGVRVSGTHTRTAQLVRAQRMRPGRYVLVAVATDRRGNRAQSRPVRIVVRR